MSLTAGSASRARAGPSDRLVGQLFRQAHALRLVSGTSSDSDRPGREILNGRGHVAAVAVEQPALPDFIEQPLVQGGLHGR